MQLCQQTETWLQLSLAWQWLSWSQVRPYYSDNINVNIDVLLFFDVLFSLFFIFFTWFFDLLMRIVNIHTRSLGEINTLYKVSTLSIVLSLWVLLHSRKLVILILILLDLLIIKAKILSVIWLYLNFFKTSFILCLMYFFLHLIVCFLLQSFCFS